MRKETLQRARKWRVYGLGSATRHACRGSGGLKTYFGAKWFGPGDSEPNPKTTPAKCARSEPPQGVAEIWGAAWCFRAIGPK